LGNQSTNKYEEIFEAESLRGEKAHWYLHWFLYTIVLLLSMSVYFVQSIDVGKYGIFLSLLNLGYNFSISWFILKGRAILWNRYVMVSINILSLTTYNYLDAYFNSSLTPVTTATLMLYPVIIFLASLRMDKVLILWATIFSILCMDGLYFWFYADFDQTIARQLVSADILGQVYRTVYLALCGVLMYSVPISMLRILRTQERLTLEILEHKNTAQKDALTGAYNRLYFEQYLESSLQTAKKFDYKLALFFIDLDGFKVLNDTYGHDMGDFILKSVTSSLTNTIRDNDLVARIGGDEFVVIMSPYSSTNEVKVFGNRLLTAISSPRHFNGQEISISSSIGVALFPEDETTMDKLIKSADEAMYVSKKTKKNEVTFYH